MKCIVKIFAACALLFPLLLKAQVEEVKKDSVLIHIGAFRADIEGASYYQSGAVDIYTPGPQKITRPGERNLQRNWQLNQGWATDNPLYHGAAYATFHSSVDITPKLRLLASLTAEHRGASYGVYPVKNMVMFPQYRFEYKDTLRRKNGKDLKWELGYGNYNNIRFAEGLMLYNMDIQGTYAHLQYENWEYELRHVGDLMFGIGLNVDDAIHNLLSYNGFKKNDKYRLKLGLGYMINYSAEITPPYTTTPKNTVDATIALYNKDKSRIYGQISYRTELPGPVLPRLAAVAGYYHKAESRKWKIESRLEARYYGRIYKYWFYNRDVYYRDTATGRYGLNYANTVGESLYPLRNYERPYNQFAVFTEYTYGDMGGLTAYANVNYKLGKGLAISCNADLNFYVINRSFIFGSVTSYFAFPFVTTGLSWEPAPNNTFFIGVSNKAMNLDKTYQTFYLYKVPMFQFQFVRKIEGFMGR